MKDAAKEMVEKKSRIVAEPPLPCALEPVETSDSALGEAVDSHVSAPAGGKATGATSDGIAEVADSSLAPPLSESAVRRASNDILEVAPAGSSAALTSPDAPSQTSPEDKRALLALALGGFAIGLTEFVIMGILPEVAEGLRVTIPQAGHFISAYALGVVVGAPLFTGLGGNKPAHKVLFWLMLWFTFFNTLSAAAYSYHSLLLSRFLSGLPHGAFFGIGAVVAGRLAPPGRAAEAAAMMFSGLTVANVIGVPSGTLLGQLFGWRLSFVLVGFAGIAAVLSVRAWMPALPKSSESGFLEDMKIFRSGQFWTVMLLTILGTGGFFAWYSYVAPLLTQVTGFKAGMVIPMMMLAGVGMTLGNAFGAKLADRYSPIVAAAALMLIMSFALLLYSAVSASKLPVVLTTFVIGALAFAIVTPVQFTMIGTAEGSEMMGSAVNQSAFNMGNALGAYLGGLPIAAGYGIASANWVGAAMAFTGVMLGLGLMAYRRGTQRSKHTGA